MQRVLKGQSEVWIPGLSDSKTMLLAIELCSLLREKKVHKFSAFWEGASLRPAVVLAKRCCFRAYPHATPQSVQARQNTDLASLYHLCGHWRPFFTFDGTRAHF